MQWWQIILIVSEGFCAIENLTGGRRSSPFPVTQLKVMFMCGSHVAVRTHPGVPGIALLGDVLWRLSHLAEEISLIRLPLSTEGLAAFVKSPFYAVDFEPITQANRLALGYQQPFPGGAP